MPFTRYGSFTKARIDRPISLGRVHLDPAVIILTFVYQELVERGDVWIVEERQEILERDVHYRLDGRRAVIMLIDHPFWQQEGTWRAGDRVEPLLYKGQVKHPQRIDFDYEHHAPEAVPEAELTDEIDLEARQRLGYDVKKYTLADPPPEPAPFDWGKLPERIE